MKDSKTESRANDHELDPVAAIILAILAGFVGKKVIDRISQDRKENEKSANRYDTELEALRRLFREGLL